MVKIYKLPLLLIVFLLTISISVSAYYEYDSTITPVNNINDITHDGTNYHAERFFSGTGQIWSGATIPTMSQVAGVNVGQYTNRLAYLGTNKDVYGEETFILRDWNSGSWKFYNSSWEWVGTKTGVYAGTEGDIVVNPYNDYIYLFLSNGIILEYNENYVYNQNITENYGITSYESAVFTEKHFVIIDYDTITDLFTFYTYDQNWNLKDTTTDTTTIALVDLRGGLFYDNSIYLSDINNDKVYKFNNPYTDTTAITIDGFNYDELYCINPTTLCTNTTAFLSVTGNLQFYCGGVDNTEYCSDSCTNTLNGDTYQGVCEQLGCENECDVLGGLSCTSGTSYATCGQYDSDACLEYGTPLFCPANQYCEETDIGAQCGGLTENNLYYNQNYLSVGLELLSQTGVVKEEGTSETTKNIVKNIVNFAVPVTTLLDTPTTYVLESFYNEQINETYKASVFETTSGNSQNYYAYSCDFKETQNFVDDLEHNNLVSNEWVGTGTINNTEQYAFIETNNEINKTFIEKINSRIDTIIELRETGTYYVEFYSDNTQLLKFEIVNDKTTFNIYVKETNNNKILFNSTSTTDDLQEIYLGTTFVSDSDSANVEISLVREVLGTDINENYYSLPLSHSTDKQPNKIVYDGNTKTLWIYQVSGSNVEEYPIYTNDEETIKTFNCQHEQLDCYDIVLFGNEQGMSTFHFRDNIQTCIASLDGLVSTEINPIVTSDERSMLERAFNVTWSDSTKMLIGIGVVFFVFILFYGVSYYERDKTFLLVGTMISGVLMFYFIIESYIPVWLIVLFGIIGAGISAQAVRSLTIGDR